MVRKDEYKLTGVLILFNNLLQSLFKSQILTLNCDIWYISNVLFYSKIFNIINRCCAKFYSCSFILGIIGLEIPLDMTITIAAITIGIAVDNSIHYIIDLKRNSKIK